MAYRTRIYVVKLILQIKKALEKLDYLKLFVNPVNGSFCAELPKKNKTKIKSVVVVYFNLGHKTRENLLTSLLQ